MSLKRTAVLEIIKVTKINQTSCVTAIAETTVEILISTYIKGVPIPKLLRGNVFSRNQM